MRRPGSSAPGRPVHLDRFALAFAGLLVFAFLVRAGYVMYTWRFVPILDARSYDWLGQGLATGHGWVMGSSAYRPPGYPFFVSAVYTVIGLPQRTYGQVLTHWGGWTGLRLVQAALATATVGLTGWLALQLAGRRVALITLGVAAIYLPFVIVGVSMMTESLLVPLELMAVNCAVRARAPDAGRRWIVLAGFFAGLSALTRGNGVAIGLALAFVVWPAVARWSWRSLAAPALLVAVMVVTIAPWTIRNAVAQHTFVPVTTELGATLSGTYNSVAAKHHYIWEAGFKYPDYASTRNNLHLTESERNSRLTSDVLTYVGKHPAAVPEAMFWNTVRLFDLEGRAISRGSAARDVGATSNVADLAVYSFWVVAVLAVGSLFSPRARRIPGVLWLVPLFLWLTEAPITTGTPRFRAPLDPWFVLLAGIGIAAVADHVIALSRGRRSLLREPVKEPA